MTNGALRRGSLTREMPAPCNLEAERSVLGAMLLCPDLVEPLAKTLPDYAFSSERHRKLFGLLIEIYRTRGTVDTVLLGDEIDRRGLAEELGDESYLADLVGSVPFASAALDHAELLRELLKKRELAEFADCLFRQARNGSGVDALIREARAFLDAAFPGSGAERRLVESGSSYYLRTGRGLRLLTNFVLRPELRLELCGGEELLRARPATQEKTFPPIDMPRQAFHGRLQFLASLRHLELQYYGRDEDLAPLVEHLLKKEIPLKRAVSQLGLHGNFFVGPDGVLGSNGLEKDPPAVLLPPSAGFLGDELRVERLFQISPAAGAELQEVLEALARDLPFLHRPEVVWPMVGFFHAAVFRERFREERLPFPVLNLYGTSGGGKTSLALLFWRLFGFRGHEPFSVHTTPFVALRLLSATNALPVVFDELKGDAGRDVVARWRALARRLYYGEQDARGTSEQHLRSYPLRAPVAICGEMALVSERALAERVIPVNPDPNFLRSAEGARAQEAYRELASLPLRGYAAEFISFVLGRDFQTTWTEAKRLLGTSTGPRDLSPRVRHNLAVVVFGIEEFRAFYGSRAERSLEIPLAAVLADLVRQLCPSREAGLDRTELDLLLEEWATLAHRGILLPELHYRTEGRLLFVHFPSAFQAARAALGDYFPLARSDYRRQARENQRAGGYLVEVERKVRLGAHTLWCMAIDLGKAEASGVDLGGFRAGTNDIKWNGTQ